MAASGPSRGHARLRVGELNQSHSLLLELRPGFSRPGVARSALDRGGARVPWPQVHVAPVSSTLCLLSCGFCLERPRQQDSARVNGLEPAGGSFAVSPEAATVMASVSVRPFDLFYHFPTSDRTRLPAEFKHITKRRKRN